MDIIGTLILFVPMLVVLWLANRSHRHRIEGDLRNERTFKLLAYGLLVLLYASLLAFGLLCAVLGAALVAAPELAGGFDAEAMGIAPDRLPWLGASLAVLSLLGMVLLTRPARRLFSRFTPIDPSHPVHAVALSFTALILVNLAATVAVGLDNLADMLQSAAEAGGAGNPAPALWAQNIIFLVMGLIGVGWLARRGLKTALLRLGIVAPTARQVLAGLGLGVLMVPLVLVAEIVAGKIGLGASADVERLTEQLVGPLTLSIPGILTLGLAAALGEETVFRGALQPRFGLVFTTLLFALLHSQYGFSFSTVAVFAVGLVLGLVRLRTNTTTAMIVHAVYNMSLGLISYLGLMQNV